MANKLDTFLYFKNEGNALTMRDINVSHVMSEIANDK